MYNLFSNQPGAITILPFSNEKTKTFSNFGKDTEKLSPDTLKTVFRHMKNQLD